MLPTQVRSWSTSVPQVQKWQTTGSKAPRYNNIPFIMADVSKLFNVALISSLLGSQHCNEWFMYYHPNISGEFYWAGSPTGSSTLAERTAHASDSVGEFALTHRDKLELAKKTVDNYVTKELQHDIPTGKQNLCYSVYRCKIDCSFCMQEWPLNAVSSTILGLVTSLAHDHTPSYWRSLGVHEKLQWPYLNCQSLIQS